MKSLASSDVSANSGSSKFHLAAKMLLRVSLSSSPRNGERPLRLTGRDWLFFFLNNSACVHLRALRCSLTACMWWRRGSTCPFWTTQNRSWWPRGRGTLVCRNSPAASPVVYICVRAFHVNPTMEDYSYHPLEHTHTLARPKSMILILLVSLLTQRMFSGWNSSKKHNIIKKWTERWTAINKGKVHLSVCYL